MRKPRDIDAELKALTDRAKALKSRKITQLGELVVATGADGLDHEILAGVLLSALETKDNAALQDWRRRGEGFFRRTGKGQSAGGASVSQAAP